MTADLVSGFLGLGQPVARTTALHAAARGRLERTLLIHGPAAAGKEAFVDDLLALLFCTDVAEVRPCNACHACRKARSRSHPDLVMGSPELWRDERSTGESIVAAARRWLLGASGAPIAGERRVVLIERADRANEQTQNALLKSLEEPGRRQMFILVADEPSRLLPTIRSRSQPLRIGAVARDELIAWLMDRERLPNDQALALARISGGLSGTAIGYARHADLLDWRRRVQAELLALLRRGRADRFGSARELVDEAARLASAPPAEVETEDGDGPRASSALQREGALRIVSVWLDLTRDLIVASAGRPELAAAGDLLPELPRLAPRIGPAPLAAFAAVLERVHAGLSENAAPRLAMEVAMLEWPTVS